MDIQQIERDFKNRGINFSKPGFYDEPGFVAAEQRDPAYLERYAQYVHARPYDAAYLARVRPIIEKAARFLHDEVKLDGRQRACADAGMVLARFLEREGVWNCLIKGAARVEFPAGSGIETNYLSPVMLDSNPANTGHAWVFAPPFVVVDPTIDLQGWSATQAAYLDGPALAEKVKPATYTVHDIVDQDVQQVFFMRERRRPKLEEFVNEAMRRRIKTYGCFSVELPRGARVTYISCAVGAADLPLEQMGCLVCRGKGPMALYDEFKRQ